MAERQAKLESGPPETTLLQPNSAKPVLLLSPCSKCSQATVTLKIMVSDDDDLDCPLCMEEFDIADRNFRPCPCGYQVKPDVNALTRNPVANPLHGKRFVASAGTI